MTVEQKHIAAALPPLPDTPRIEVTVLCTTDAETSAALAAAAVFAHKLDTLIRLVSFVVVPYPLDLTQPSVAPSFTVDHCTALVQGLNLDANIQICYCRDLKSGVGQALRSKSLVLMGRKPRWWALRENRLARLVRSGRHDLLVVDVR
ncbi:MAG: hypothetical protein ABSH09_15235 [Bryobacteraceae bacterium]|jgi:hypothetical protein